MTCNSVIISRQKSKTEHACAHAQLCTRVHKHTIMFRIIVHTSPLNLSCRINFVSRHVEVAGQGDVQLDLDALPPEQQKELVVFVKTVLDARSETVLETFSYTALL